MVEKALVVRRGRALGFIVLDLVNVWEKTHGFTKPSLDIK